MSAEQRRTLESWVRAQNTPLSVALRAGIVLLAADGRSNSQIAREVNVSLPTVILWRRRFQQGGPGVLTEIALGRGRRVPYGAKLVNENEECMPRRRHQEFLRSLGGWRGNSPRT